jgi:ATP-dependent helicase/nuclease subunit A
LQFEEGAGPAEGSQLGSFDAVQIMTIHGAKGLEAPVVFLADANASVDADNWNILVDWTPGDDVPNHFSIYGARKDDGSARKEFFQRHDLLNKVEDTNLLYVAVTRAKQALFVSGVASKKQEASSWYFQLKDAVASCKEAQGLEDAFGVQRNPKESVALGVDEQSTNIKKEHFSIGTRFVELNNASVEFGTLVHKILEMATIDIRSISKNSMKQMFEVVSDDFDRAWDASLRIINAPSMKRFFDSQEYLKAQNEVAYVNRNGDIRRIDRLVEFDEEIWIVDYKISLNQDSKPNAALLRQYKSQLVQYRDDLANIRVDKPIRIGVVLSSGELIEL